MAQPVVEVRIAWRGAGLSLLANDGFETDTSGWSVAAGINAAATSITRTLTTPYSGVAAADLVTTATLTSGAKNVLSGTFTSGRTYRFGVYLKSISGTTSARLRIGSLGTPADRATSTMTLTTSYVAYSVDWTPSANRSDVQITIENNAASIMTARLDAAEVFEVLDDISNDVAAPQGGTSLQWQRGANFDGSSEAPGAAVIVVRNDAKKYNPANTSGPLGTLLKIGREVWVRCTYGGAPYAVFHGYLRRVVPLDNGYAELHCQDALFWYSRKEVSIAVSDTRSVRAFRDAILTGIGELTVRRALVDGMEADNPLTGADRVNAFNRLTELNGATGSIHFIKPSPSASVGYAYTVVNRNMLQAAANDETFSDTDFSQPFPVELGGYDYTDEGIINSQRAAAQIFMRSNDITVVWDLRDVPFTVDAGVTNSLWSSYAASVFNQTLAYVSSGGAPTVILTGFDKGAKIDITGGTGGSTISQLQVSGQMMMATPSLSQLVQDTASITTYGEHAGSVIDNPYFASHTLAKGLAQWIIFRYATPRARPSMTVQNRFPSQLQRDISDRVTLTTSWFSVSAKEYLLRSQSTSISDSGAVWQTVYDLEEVPTVLNLFTVGGTADQGVGGTAILGY